MNIYIDKHCHGITFEKDKNKDKDNDKDKDKYKDKDKVTERPNICYIFVGPIGYRPNRGFHHHHHLLHPALSRLSINSSIQVISASPPT